jgi:FAD/FMN-containing dehydrogenase
MRCLQINEFVEAGCRDEIMKNGGSISHHHGVGKTRKQFEWRMQSEVGLKLHKELKKAVDPNNIFAINNTVYTMENEEKEDLDNMIVKEKQ